MKSLELKIPPVLVFFMTAALMWAVSLKSNELGVHRTLRFVIVAVFLTMGGLIAVSGVLNFRKARTTVDPRKPNKTSSLVNSGIYRYTRNPMYAGLLLVLIAWGCFLDNVFSLLLVFFFFIYMTQFQIKPEERVLESIFGKDYKLYKERVRRWL